MKAARRADKAIEIALSGLNVVEHQEAIIQDGLDFSNK